MYKYVAFACILACAIAAPAEPSDDASAQITHYDSQINPDGSYVYSYGTSNGIEGKESGAANAAQGTVSYVSPEGIKIDLSYVADENGFQPTGEHLPTPPPTPELILKSLEYIRAHPPAEEPSNIVQVS